MTDPAIQAARDDLHDLALAAKEAHERLTADLPRLASWLQACYDVLYADGRRFHETHKEADDPPDRVKRCGACEHPDTEHADHGCEHDECRCHRLEPYPSTVGWAQWTAPGQAEKAYVAACKHLQRANDAIGKIRAVPAHWASDALVKPGNRTVPIRITNVLHGVRLLKAALAWVDCDDLAAPEASALMEAADEIRSAIRRIVKAQDPLDDDAHRELRTKRCSVWVSASKQCQVEHHADGKCRQHYDATRRREGVR